jgi:hypothetical protein
MSATYKQDAIAHIFSVDHKHSALKVVWLSKEMHSSWALLSERSFFNIMLFLEGDMLVPMPTPAHIIPFEKAL